jgi:RHS repeat-associated protein
VRDAQGNVMAVYESSAPNKTTAAPVFLTEHHIYGSSRLGMVRRHLNVDSARVDTTYASLIGQTVLSNQLRGIKLYELANHLGNVLVTLTDRKIGVPSASNSSLIDHYEADVASANDYYPFGMLMPGRSFSDSGLYRYGFNGKENDVEVKGDGAQYDYGFKIYDPRIGKFLSVDPLTKSFPTLTPYQFSNNTPIASADLDGLEGTINFNYSDSRFMDFFKGLVEEMLDEDFDAKPYEQCRTALADPAAIQSNPFVQQALCAFEMARVALGEIDLKETT